MESDFSLSDSGKRVRFKDYCFPDGPISDDAVRDWREVEREVVMIIKAPRGQATVFRPTDELCPYFGSYIPQGDAVRAFVEQHRDD